MTQKFDSIKILITIKNIIDAFYLRVPNVFALHVEGLNDPGSIKNKRFSIYSRALPKFFKGWKFLINKQDESLVMIAPTQMDKLGDLWRK
jgi:hypothetical protein